MPFVAPSWVPKLPVEIPDSIPISDFMLDENHGRHPLGYSLAPFVCGVTGRSYTALDVKERVDCLARGLAKEMGWSPNKGSEWDKVVGVFSCNTLDTVPLAWATHRLGGLQTPANAAYSASEVAYQLENSSAQCLFTCAPQLETALKAAGEAKLPRSRIYMLEIPGVPNPEGYKTVNELIVEGANLPRLEPLKWSPGEGATRTAFLCYSSGTSGLPKGVMISHYNIIANTLQMVTYEERGRKNCVIPGNNEYTENVLGLLPMSHIYCLVAICHPAIFRGDGVIILPKFDFKQCMQTIQEYRIATLFLVPPIIIMMTKQSEALKQFDLSSVKAVFTGAAPLGEETAADLSNLFPSWYIRQGYGLTETATVVCATANHDIWFGSSGSILPSLEVKLIAPEGNEVTGYDQPGELCVKSPAVALGYLNNDKANTETFVTDGNGDRWMHTGDEAVIKKNPKSGIEHVFIVDRIKELIKVKGLQVAPAELEAHLLTHPHVADCAVIPVPDERAGEVPKAFVVKSAHIGIEDSDRLIMRQICKHVEDHKSRHKWLVGGIEFTSVIPKSPSGKILRRLLRDKDREARREKRAKL